MYVNEIFLSIQGESSFVGLPCVFVRLAGCNLGCEWCDTPYARAPEDSVVMGLDEVIAEVTGYGRQLVEITGGEPLLQEETIPLAERLLASGRKVLLETNGTVSLKKVPAGVVKIVDIKCPSSGFEGSFLTENLDYMVDDDEVKFVIGDRADFDFAKNFYQAHLEGLAIKVLFAPVTDVLHPDVLADWILSEGLGVRLQVQMHRYVWKEARGR